MLQTRSEVFKMRSQLQNNMRERLTYCLDWKKSIDIYLANREITEKANNEYYKTKPLLRLILGLYFIPYNLLKFFRYSRILHDYKKNQAEILYFLLSLTLGLYCTPFHHQYLG